MVATDEFEYEIATQFPDDCNISYIPNPGPGLERDGVLIKFQLASGLSWYGMFAFGDLGSNGKQTILRGPAADQLTIVAGGAGYIASASFPQNWVTVKCFPVLRAIPVPKLSLVFFHDFTELIAYGANGIVWESARISYDGIEISKVTDAELSGRAWNAPSGSHVDFAVDLMTGKHTGGADVS